MYRCIKLVAVKIHVCQVIGNSVHPVHLGDHAGSPCIQSSDHDSSERVLILIIGAAEKYFINGVSLIQTARPPYQGACPVSGRVQREGRLAVTVTAPPEILENQPLLVIEYNRRQKPPL
jgi:hypothetical protein